MIRFQSLNLRKVLNLKLLLTIEMVYSFFPYFYKRYFIRWKFVPENELKYLQENCGVQAIKKIVLIGGGAIPYTAIFLNQIMNLKDFVIIEKNKISSLAAARLLKKLNLMNLKVVNMNGEDYSTYDNNLVIVSLQATGKQKIIDKILNEAGNNILIVRQPLRKGRRIFETASLNGFKYATVEQKPDFESIILAK